MHIKDPAIPFGSLVVVIGANGYIGVETCRKLLEAGYRVRGTVRDVARHRPWMHALFEEKWPRSFELVCVQDFEADGAFDGATGVIYVSTPVVFDVDLAKVLTPVVDGTLNTLKAAASAGVQRYVLNSSSKAVESTVYNQPHTLTTAAFNHDALRQAGEATATVSPERSLAVYSAGRTAAELAFWAWVKENNPPFVANCVVPDGAFGRVLDIDHANTGPASSIGMLKRALAGNWDNVIPQLAYFTSVEDTARLLVAATVLPTVRNERIFSYYHQSTWNDLRTRVSELFPDRPGIVGGKDLDIVGRDLSSADEPIQRAESILKEIGQAGFVGLDDILCDFVDSFYPE